MMKYDVVIVGGGIAGLTAAIYAAKTGKKTVVLEQQNQLGGRASTKKRDGVYFDVGGHALYKSDALEIFKELDVTFDAKEPSSDAFGLWKEKLFTLPMGVMSLLQSPLFTWKGKIEIAKWLGKLGKLDTKQLNNVSVRDWIEGNLKDPMVRNFFYSLLRTPSYVLAPDLQAAGPVLRQLINSMKGVLYLDKGWGALVEQLRAKAVVHGAEFHTGTKVEAVDHQDGKVQVVRCKDGTKIIADNVILTTSPVITHKLVEHAEQTALQLWKDQAIPVTAACLTVVLRKLPKPKHQFIYGIDQPFFYTNQSRAALLSDNGDQVIQLIKYQGIETNAKQDEQDMEKFMDVAQPGWREELVTRQYLPKVVVVHDFTHVKRKLNPGPNVPEIEGLYVAGDWATHGELLADAAAASAKRAVEHMITRPSEERATKHEHRVVV